MNKCNHEKVCQECIQEEIKKHEDEIAELRKKLPVPTGNLEINTSTWHPCCTHNNWNCTCPCHVFSPLTFC